MFLGIGAGPIQTGIFVKGACDGGFGRLVLADVDKDIVESVCRSGSLTVNTAFPDCIRGKTYTGIEIYDPSKPKDMASLIQAASEASAVATALPSTRFYAEIAGWLREGFRMRPDKRRFVFAAENSNTAAEELKESIGEFPSTFYLNTVIGKMSKVFDAAGTDMPPLAPGCGKGHLVESFDTIYTDNAPGFDDLGIVGLHSKESLEPFECAKLYGHNACHFLLALLALENACLFMPQARAHKKVIDSVGTALKQECGRALCRKFRGADELFTEKCFARYADDLIERMTSPTLDDSVERVLRDIRRKLGWNDRITGAVNLCIEQDVFPKQLLEGLRIALDRTCAGWRDNPDLLSKLWSDATEESLQKIIAALIAV